MHFYSYFFQFEVLEQTTVDEHVYTSSFNMIIYVYNVDYLNIFFSLT